VTDEERAQRRLIGLLSVGAFGSAASMRVADAQLPALADVFGISLAAAAQVITVFSVGYGLLQLAYGPIGDRLGKWRVIAAAVMASGVASALCAAAPDFRMLLAARVLAGATCAAIIPLSMAWVGDAVPYERRQPVLARFLLGQISGMALGQWLGGVAADLHLWRLPFAVLAVWFVVAGAILWRTRLAAETFAPTRARSGNLLTEAGYVLRQRWARVILLVVMLEAVTLFGAFAFLATHLHLQYGVSLSRAGSIATFYAVGGLTFALASGRLVRRLGEPGLARGGGLLIALGLLAVAVSPVWWTAPIACAAAGLGFYMFHNTLQTNATQMAPDARGAAVSLFAASFFVGQTFGVGVVSLLVERAGTAPVIAAAGLLVALLCFWFAARRARLLDQPA
jgi:predicted MFS family arabinose efflux permease